LRGNLFRGHDLVGALADDRARGFHAAEHRAGDA
jgi:hypothetical protein